MKDTPGWASPGSAPSDGQEPGASGPAEPADHPGPSDQPGTDPQGPGSKWSKEQPPPAQWSAPTGPENPAQTPPPPPPAPGWGNPPTGPGAPGTAHGGYGGGYGGQGGYGGWGSGWGGPPPAAKPGVIPLRPLGVGEILDGAVSTMRTYWRTVLGISLTVAVVTQILVILLQGLALDDINTAAPGPDASPDELARALGDTMLSTSVIFLISLIGTIAATALLTTVTSRAVLGKSVTTGEAWRDARPQVAKLFGLIFLLILIAFAIVAAGVLPGVLVAVAGSGDAGAGLAVLGGLAAGVVALWLMIRFSLASPALMLEKQGILKSLSRSVKLVRGSWWRVFGIQLLATIIANIVASIVVIPFAFLASALDGEGFTGLLSTGGDLGWTYLVVSGIGSVIGAMITFPITAGVTVLLYIDQRIRREALDLDLARAAGVQDYGSGAPGATAGG
ncbi:glycerophosphoryl diester phosphodiesterase membrane domain-containing protein [Streptomyces sp. RG80]|uniref:glycerophosphoryl diester phosphodiesterase membrane domain-containing protein n=1 Tax=Streptomyces sp. RG80 TaxID=3157340 RepID=UPI00338E8D7F